MILPEGSFLECEMRETVVLVLVVQYMSRLCWPSQVEATGTSPVPLLVVRNFLSSQLSLVHFPSYLLFYLPVTSLAIVYRVCLRQFPFILSNHPNGWFGGNISLDWSEVVTYLASS